MDRSKKGRRSKEKKERRKVFFLKRVGQLFPHKRERGPGLTSGRNAWAMEREKKGPWDIPRGKKRCASSKGGKGPVPTGSWEKGQSCLERGKMQRTCERSRKTPPAISTRGKKRDELLRRRGPPEKREREGRKDLIIRRERTPYYDPERGRGILPG